MNKIVFIFTFLLFLSCEKIDNVENFSVKTNLKTEELPNMLKFEDIDELCFTISEISSMTENEILKFEQENNYISFARVSNNVYDNIDFEKFTSTEELISYVESQKDYIEINMIDGEYYVNPLLNESIYRYIANENALFAIGDTVYKVFKDGIVSTNGKNLQELMSLGTNHELYKSDKFEFSPFKFDIVTKVINVNGAGVIDRDEKINGKEKVIVKLGVSSASFNGVTTYEMYIQAAAQKKFLGAWHAAPRTITYDFEISVNSPNHQLPLFKKSGSKGGKDVTFTLYGGVHAPNAVLTRYKCEASIPAVPQKAIIKHAM